MPTSGTQLGPYRLLRRIGSGGMAEVHLAKKLGAVGFARHVAIKTIHAHGVDEEGISLFLDEARVAAILDHAAIVQTLDLGFEQDTLFIVMEYVVGPSFGRIIRALRKQKRRLPPEITAYVGARIASALNYANQRVTTPDGKPLSLVHRDISPQNIMLTRAGLVKLTDFGVAQASIQTHKTRTGQVRGKAAYMAPEQVRAKSLDGRTDIFALGAVLYEALTGLRPFQRKTDINSMRAVLKDEPPPIRERNEDVSDSFIALVSRALAKDPDDRFASAREVEAELIKIYETKATGSRIEVTIAELITELFGAEEAYEEEAGLQVEAWQPTMASGPGLEPSGAEALGRSEISSKLRNVLEASSDSGEGISYDSNPAVLHGQISSPSSDALEPESHTFAEVIPNTLSDAGAQTTGTYASGTAMRWAAVPLLVVLLGVVIGVGYTQLGGPAAESINASAPPPPTKPTVRQPSVVAKPPPPTETVEEIDKPRTIRRPGTPRTKNIRKKPPSSGTQTPTQNGRAKAPATTAASQVKRVSSMRKRLAAAGLTGTPADQRLQTLQGDLVMNNGSPLDAKVVSTALRAAKKALAKE